MRRITDPSYRGPYSPPRLSEGWNQYPCVRQHVCQHVESIFPDFRQICHADVPQHHTLGQHGPIERECVPRRLRSASKHRSPGSVHWSPPAPPHRAPWNARSLAAGTLGCVARCCPSATQGAPPALELLLASSRGRRCDYVGHGFTITNWSNWSAPGSRARILSERGSTFFWAVNSSA